MGTGWEYVAGAALAATGMLGKYYDARNSNANLRKANENALQANQVNTLYEDAGRAKSQSKLGKDYARYAASQAIFASVSGSYGGASSTAADLSSLANAFIDSNIIDFNSAAQKNQNAVNTRNQIMSNDLQYQNPLMAAFAGGLQGWQAGYSLGNTFNSRETPKQAPENNRGYQGNSGGDGDYTFKYTADQKRGY